MLQIKLNDESHTLKLGTVCGNLAKDQPMRRLVLGLTGTLGTGKTTFTKGVARALDVDEPVCSPTFTMLHEYTSGELPLYHIDLYRLSDEKSEAAVGELAYELPELLDGPCILVVEWIDLHPSLLQEVEDLRLTFSYCEDGSRLVRVEEHKQQNLLQKIRDSMASDI